MDKALRTVPGIQKALSKHSLLDDDEEGDDDDDILQWEGKNYRNYVEVPAKSLDAM